MFTPINVLELLMCSNKRILKSFFFIILCFPHFAFGSGELPSFCSDYKSDSPYINDNKPYCIQDQTISIDSRDVHNLTGFMKAGSKTSFHYIAKTKKDALKEQIRKNVLKRLLQKRSTYLGSYMDTKSKFEEIGVCASKFDLLKEFTPDFNIKMQDKRNYFAKTHLEAAFLINSYLKYEYEHKKNTELIQDKLKKLLSNTNLISFKDSPKEKLKKVSKSIREYASSFKDKNLLDSLNLLLSTYENSNCISRISKRSRVQSKSREIVEYKGRVSNGLALRNFECLDQLGRKLDNDPTSIISELFKNSRSKAMAPMYALAEKYPLLVESKELFQVFSKSDSIKGSPLLNKIISDLDLQSADSNSQFLKHYQIGILDAFKSNDKNIIDSLVNNKGFRDNLQSMLNRSEFRNIFDRSVSQANSNQYMSIAQQEYIAKLDDSILNFCHDEDLEIDYHNHPSLVSEILSDPKSAYPDLPLKDALISAQISYCYLLEQEPPKEGGISSSSVAGFGLLAAGGVASLFGLAPVAVGAFTIGGAILTGVTIHDIIEQNSLIDNEVGYIALGIGDIIKLHQLQAAQNTNKALLALDVAVLGFDISMIRAMKKKYDMSKASNQTPNAVPLHKNETQGYEDVFNQLGLTDLSRSIKDRNITLKSKDLKIIGDSNELSRFKFDAFHDGEYVPEIVKALTKATKEDMVVINKAIETVLKNADQSKHADLDVLIEFALTKPHGKAIEILKSTDTFLSKVDSGSKDLTKIEKEAKKAIERYHRLNKANSKKGLSAHQSFDEQSEWMKCNSPRYKLKRSEGYSNFLKSVPAMELAVVPTAAVLSNVMNGDKANWDMAFLKTLANELLFTHFVLPKIFKRVGPMLLRAGKINSKVLQSVSQAGIFFSAGLAMGAIKGKMLELINTLPLEERGQLIELYYSSEFNKELEKMVNDTSEKLSKMSPEQMKESMGIESDQDLEAMEDELIKSISSLDKSNKDFMSDFKERYWDDLSMTGKLSVVDSSFSAINSFKIVMVSNLLSPYFCMANSDILTEAQKKKYQRRGFGAFFSQSIATGVIYFQYRDLLVDL